MRAFDEFCADFTLTKKERNELIWFLAQFRMNKTLRVLGWQQARCQDEERSDEVSAAD